jgi:hypothetical protein
LKQNPFFSLSLSLSIRSLSHIVAPLGELDRGVDDQTLGSFFCNFE